MKTYRAILGCTATLCLIACSAWSDSLELKNGSLIKGRYVGGTASEISFKVGSSVQKYNVQDIQTLTFDSRGASSSSMSDGAPSNTPDGPSSSSANDMPVRPNSLTGQPGAVENASLRSGDTVTIPAGTQISVRTIDSIDSTRNHVGDRFTASLEQDLYVGDQIVVKKGANVYGRLANAQAAGTFSGSSQLKLELTGIVIDGRTVPIITGNYDLKGKSQGASTAKRTVGGAAVGSLIGALAGGGKGAAIGAGVGGAAGAGSKIITKGDQVKVPSETLLDFTLQQPVTVTPVQ